LRVVCDTRLSLPLTLKLFSKTLAAGTVVACGAKASPARRRALEARGVRVCVLPADAEGISPDALLRWLARQGCQDVLLEGGARLGTAWLRQGCIDRVALFTAPRVLGCEGLGWCGPLGLAGLRQAITGRLTQCERVGEDALLVVEVRT
jgi:diaminohydroxyphosphoribosylaminopyrimidine deaminase/5-amino-6-(5-phosphoribosylamino)uracil reductase